MENPLWHRAREDRKYQHFFGIISGALLLVALLALFDGLLAQMRQGPNELELLPGQSVIVSGPAVLKNPLNSDLVARFSPENAPLRFALEGFFTGYWFGNGMWRGEIIADQNAAAGKYNLRISFKGASAQHRQNYTLIICESPTALRAASLSLIKRYLNLNPFILAAWAGLSGIIAGLFTYFFGRRFGKALSKLGLSEIYSSDPATANIWCLAPKVLAPKNGLCRMVLDPEGHVFGEARSIAWKKGKLQLEIMDKRQVPSGALVCLKHPDIQAKR